MNLVPIAPPIGDYGLHVPPDLYVVSWLGMTDRRIDCHVYALRGRDGLLLIDCGTPWGHDRLLRNLAHWGLKIDEVRTVLFTHGHVDHAAAGYRFKERGIELLGHREMLAEAEGQWAAEGALDPDGEAWRMDGTLADGMRVERCGLDIEVIATPGHTRGCLSYLIKVGGQRCLFSGDLIMGDGLPGWAGDEGHDPGEIVKSLQRLRILSFEHLCYGHGAILHDHGALFREALRAKAEGKWVRDGAHYSRDPLPDRRQTEDTRR